MTVTHPHHPYFVVCQWLCSKYFRRRKTFRRFEKGGQVVKYYLIGFFSVFGLLIGADALLEKSKRRKEK